MRLLIDLSSVTGGGGAEQSISLLKSLVNDTVGQRVHVECVVRRGSRIEAAARALGIPHDSIGNGWAARIYFSARGAGRLIREHRLDAVYVAFGVGVEAPRHVPQVINVAYPIICYPDSPYWRHLPYVQRVRTRMKVWARATLVRARSTVVVAENDLMARRLAQFARIPGSIIRVLPPVLGGTAASMRLSTPRQPGPRLGEERPLDILFVSGADFHKNLWRLAACASRLRDKCVDGITFRLTVTEADFRKVCHRAGMPCPPDIARYFAFLGPRFGDALVQEIAACHVLANISDLESISNNFIEAAAADKPMLIAQRDFAVESVRVPYVVCEPHDPASIEQAIERIRRGEFQLPKYNGELAIDSADRTKMLLEMIEGLLRCGRKS